MSRLLPNLKLIVLDSPFENWDHPLVPSLFAKMVSLKKLGYHANYDKGVLPVDTTDLIARHVLLCRGESPDFEPIMGYKTTTLKDCKTYNLVFPGLSLVRSAKATQQIEAVEKIVERCEHEDLGLSYLGSWTIDAKVRDQLHLRQELREIFMATYCFSYNEQNISEVVIGGTPRFKTEAIFSKLGHTELELDGQTLPRIHVAHLMKEPVIVMHGIHQASFNAKIEEKWKSLWIKRLHIGSNSKIKKRAA